jgi:hypothetical protein
MPEIIKTDPANQETNKSTTAKTTASKAKKKAAPKAKAKAKTTASKAKKTTETKKAPRVDRSMADIPASEQRVKFCQSLKKLGATSPGTAVSGKTLAGKLGWTQYNVYLLGYRTSPLVVDGLVKSAKMEEAAGLSYYLTAKGLKAE